MSWSNANLPLVVPKDSDNDSDKDSDNDKDKDKDNDKDNDSDTKEMTLTQDVHVFSKEFNLISSDSDTNAVRYFKT